MAMARCMSLPSAPLADRRGSVSLQGIERHHDRVVAETAEPYGAAIGERRIAGDVNDDADLAFVIDDASVDGESDAPLLRHGWPPAWENSASATKPMQLPADSASTSALLPAFRDIIQRD